MFEFDDLYLYEDVVHAPADKDVFIHMKDGRAIVTRCFYLTEQVWKLDHCLNWKELEAESARFITRLSLGARRHAELYPCPQRIAVCARWK
jgi:hypothetical protein